jgi:hypothetical protein
MLFNHIYLNHLRYDFFRSITNDIYKITDFLITAETRGAVSAPLFLMKGY